MSLGFPSAPLPHLSLVSACPVRKASIALEPATVKRRARAPAPVSTIALSGPGVSNTPEMMMGLPARRRMGSGVGGRRGRPPALPRQCRAGPRRPGVVVATEGDEGQQCLGAKVQSGPQHDPGIHAEEHVAEDRTTHAQVSGDCPPPPRLRRRLLPGFVLALAAPGFVSTRASLSTDRRPSEHRRGESPFPGAGLGLCLGEGQPSCPCPGQPLEQVRLVLASRYRRV